MWHPGATPEASKRHPGNTQRPPAIQRPSGRDLELRFHKTSPSLSNGIQKVPKAVDFIRLVLMVACIMCGCLHYVGWFAFCVLACILSGGLHSGWWLAFCVAACIMSGGLHTVRKLAFCAAALDCALVFAERENQFSQGKLYIENVLKMLTAIRNCFRNLCNCGEFAAFS